MRILTFLLGLILLLVGIYFLGKNIIFTTQISPYWWRGIAADSSILMLTAGLVGVLFLPRSYKNLGWIAIGIGILLIFLGSRAVLNPTSLWQFLVSACSFLAGYQLLTTGRLRF
jgi:hypothetical protein